jgi:hypothetical protein
VLSVFKYEVSSRHATQRSIAHLLLAETYSAQLTNCCFLLEMIYIRTITVCVWCIVHVFSVLIFILIRHAMQRSFTHLLLAKTYSTQSTNCRLLLKMIDSRTKEAFHCLRLVYHSSVKRIKCVCIRYSVQKKLYTLSTGKDIQYTVHKLSLATKNDWFQDYRGLSLSTFGVSFTHSAYQVCLNQTLSAKEASHTCYWQRHTVHSPQTVTCP